MIMTPLVLAMAVSTAVFPTLAEESARDRPEAVREVFLLSLRAILFLTIPMAIGLAILGEPLIRLLFEHGEWSGTNTRMTAYALNFFAIGLVGHAAVEIVDRVFYALEDTRTPVLVASGAFGLNLLLSLVLMHTSLNFGGLALASSLAALAEGAVLLRLLSRRVPGLALGPIARSLSRTLAAGLLMGITILALPELLQEQLLLPQTLELAVVVTVVALAGAATYLLFAWMLGSEEPRLLLRLGRSRG